MHSAADAVLMAPSKLTSVERMKLLISLSICLRFDAKPAASLSMVFTLQAVPKPALFFFFEGLPQLPDSPLPDFCSPFWGSCHKLPSHSVSQGALLKGLCNSPPSSSHCPQPRWRSDRVRGLLRQIQALLRPY